MTDRAITSLQNPRVKEAAWLRDARHRIRSGRFVIDGIREIERAVAAGLPIVEAFACPELASAPSSREVLDRLHASGAEVWQVTPEVFEKLAYGQRHEGIVAVAATPDASIARLHLPPEPVVAVLSGVEKPGNVGAVIRTADAAGVSAVVIADGGTDLFNPNAIRASLGTIFSMPLAAVAAGETLDWLRSQGLAIFAARPDAALVYTDAQLTGPVALVLGSEAAGLADAWQAPDITALKLPMRGIADSLNVSVAAAVLFYEVLRQREGPERINKQPS